MDVKEFDIRLQNLVRLIQQEFVTVRYYKYIYIYMYVYACVWDIG